MESKTVWKYDLIPGNQGIEVPIHSRVLCVQTQGGKAKLWVLVNPNNPTETKTIHIYGTGHEITNAESKIYIGTFQINEGELVFHVFENTK